MTIITRITYHGEHGITFDSDKARSGYDDYNRNNTCIILKKPCWKGGYNCVICEDLKQHNIEKERIRKEIEAKELEKRKKELEMRKMEEEKVRKEIEAKKIEMRKLEEEKIRKEIEAKELEKRKIEEENGQIIITSSSDENSVKNDPIIINKKESIFSKLMKIIFGRRD